MLPGDFRMAALIGIPISRYRIDRAKGKPANACQCEGRRGGHLEVGGHQLLRKTGRRYSHVRMERRALDEIAARPNCGSGPNWTGRGSRAVRARLVWLVELLRASDRAAPRRERDSLRAMERPEVPERVP
jgi:hypothetical protein